MWARFVEVGIGVWLMFAPAVLGYGGALAVSDRIVGPCAASFAAIAMGKCTRGVRWWNVPAGVWLVLAPLVLPGVVLGGGVSSVASGLALGSLSMVRGRVEVRYAGGWGALIRPSGGTVGGE